ncbi:MAG: hypothetical protein CVT49_08820 [candidate division Zixibacteria bacterium HGW-Zixibacteria-1]|nr:MAG: hypothetical protein CVT49_08820 [candidate division Zixibacteria bacterium HGW-Zixibacteria-1]
MLIMPMGCDKDRVLITVPETPSFDGFWIDNFNAITIPFIIDSVVFVDSGWIYVPPKTCTTSITPMKSVVVFEDSLFDVKVFKDDETLVTHHAGRFRVSRDTFYIYEENGIDRIFGYEFRNADSLYIFDFRYADTTGPVCFIVGENLILWDAGPYNLSLQGRGVFIRERYHVFK